MNDNSVAHAPPDEDRTPTQEEDAAQPIKPPDNWVMPEPVFRQSSGYTPKGVEKRVENNVATPLPEDPTEAGATVEAVSAEEASGAAAPAVSEQPNILDDNPAAEAPAPFAKKKRGAFRFLLVILGVGAVILAALAVIAAVVFWYFLRVSESQNLN